MYKISCVIADASVKRNWIQEKDRDWCVYAVENKLMALLFFSLVLTIALAMGVIGKAIIFTLSFYAIRRRIGGWHAPFAWLCQATSLVLVLIVLLLAGPSLSKMPYPWLWRVNLFWVVIAFALKPLYPPQLYFDQKIFEANNKKKKRLLSVIVAVEILFGHIYKDVLIYCSLGVAASVILIYIEKIHQLWKEVTAK